MEEVWLSDVEEDWLLDVTGRSCSVVAVPALAVAAGILTLVPERKWTVRAGVEAGVVAVLLLLGIGKA